MKKLVNYSKAVFISDIHAPFQDEIALNALEDFIKWFKPDTIFYLGDVIDFYAISRFVKDPKRSLNLQSEIDQACGIIRDIRKISTAKTYFIRGNHELRLQKYLWTQAKELSGLKSLNIENLLELKKNNIIYVPEGRMLFNNILIKHGNVVRKFSGYTAKAEFEKSGLSGVSAHTHRLGVYRHNNDSGAFVWAESGCLCSNDPDYMEGEAPNWSLGFSIGYFNNKSYHLDIVPIINGKAIYAGHEFY